MNEMQVIRVRYWAAARAAAGVPEEIVEVNGPISLTNLRAELVASHVAQRSDTRLAAVLPICSVLVGDRPVSSEDPAQVVVRPGDVVEFLPPFAGG